MQISCDVLFSHVLISINLKSQSVTFRTDTHTHSCKSFSHNNNNPSHFWHARVEEVTTKSKQNTATWDKRRHVHSVSVCFSICKQFVFWWNFTPGPCTFCLLVYTIYAHTTRTLLTNVGINLTVNLSNATHGMCLILQCMAMLLTASW